MVYIGEIMINKVKAAGSVEEVKLIVDKYLAWLKAVNHHGIIDKKYTRNILVALKYHKSVEFDEHVLRNVVTAIDVVKKLHAQGTETPW
jgi:hypothetical protein